MDQYQYPYRQCIKEILTTAFSDKKIRINFLLGLLFLLLSVLSSLALPVILKKIIDLFLNSDQSFIVFLLLSYGIIWTISQISVHLRTLLIFKIEQRLTLILGTKILSHLFDLSVNYFVNQQPGALTNIIRRAQQNVPPIVLGLFFHVIPTLLEFFFVVSLIYYFYPFIYSLLMVIILGSFFAYTLLSLKMALKAREQANDADKDADGVVADWVSNYEAVKVFGKSDLALNTCESELKKRETSEIKFMRLISFSYIGQSMILGIGLSLFTYLVGQGVVLGSLTVGDFVLFNGYILQLVVPVAILGQVIQDIKKTILDMKGIIRVLLTPPEITEAPFPLKILTKSPSITFDNVSFRYKERFILKKVSFKIKPGEVVQIMGPTGVGKSTIAKLLLRLFDPTEGTIFVDRTNLRQVSLKSLSETIRWIPQETYLLNNTIQNNLTFVHPDATIVHPDATMREIEEALHLAHLLEFINTLPDGLNTVVGNRGLKLSGGEKQRLSIARIFLKKPKICVFDESTSSLDQVTETAIQENILTHLPHTTKVIITHRSFLKDRIDQVIHITPPS